MWPCTHLAGSAHVALQKRMGHIHGPLHETENLGAASVIPARMPQWHFHQTSKGLGASVGFPTASDNLSRLITVPLAS